MYEDFDDEEEFFVLSNRKLKPNVKPVIVEELDINSQLDTYIDYMTLYEMFGDAEYLTVANGTLRNLRG